MNIKLSNTLTGKKEDFVPINEKKVGIYSCGPTVYWNQHIGHMYAFVQWDSMVRMFRRFGYEVTWVMNITDVGHMTSDDDWGEDKMEKGAEREGISVWDLADKYISQFEKSISLLNIQKPDVLPRATKHIPEQIGLAKKIEANDFSYLTKMGLLYDTSKFKDYPKFAHLKLDDQKSRSDVEVDPEKKNLWDFFLWVTGNKKHIMKWESPWGEGYPGWHLECTAMSVKYLGENFDIHTGGVEHIPVHHTNEIAQGYAAFGSKTANYWLHNAHLSGKDGEKMSKSLGNFMTVDDLAKEGFDPLALRYLILTSHYKKGLRFSMESLKASEIALKKLRDIVKTLRSQKRNSLSQEKLSKAGGFVEKFDGALSDDLNYASAIAVLWEAVKSNIPGEDKLDLIFDFDTVLGLDLSREYKDTADISKAQSLLSKRNKLRGEKKFEEADKIRQEIEDLGYLVEDNPEGARLKSK